MADQKGLGMASRRPPEWDRPDYAPSDQYGPHSEFWHSRSKHSSHGGDVPWSYRRWTQDQAGQGGQNDDPNSNTEYQNKAERFYNDFDNDIHNTPGIGEGKLIPYAEINEDIYNRKAAEWRRRARQYGLTEQEADDIIGNWLGLND